MIVKTGNKTHDDKVVTLEVARQVSVTPTASAATVFTAEKTFFQQAALSAVSNSVTPGEFLLALQERRIGLYG